MSNRSWTRMGKRSGANIIELPKTWTHIKAETVFLNNLHMKTPITVQLKNDYRGLVCSSCIQPVTFRMSYKYRCLRTVSVPSSDAAGSISCPLN